MFISAELFKEYVKDKRTASLAGVIRQAYIIYGKDKLQKWLQAKLKEINGWDPFAFRSLDAEYWADMMLHLAPRCEAEAQDYYEDQQRGKAVVVCPWEVCGVCHKEYNLHAPDSKRSALIRLCAPPHFATLERITKKKWKEKR